MRILVGVAAVVAAALLHPQTALAVPVTLQFTGVVTTATPDTYVPLFPEGTEVTWTVTYESDVRPYWGTTCDGDLVGRPYEGPLCGGHFEFGYSEHQLSWQGQVGDYHFTDAQAGWLMYLNLSATYMNFDTAISGIAIDGPPLVFDENAPGGIHTPFFFNTYVDFLSVPPGGLLASGHMPTYVPDGPNDGRFVLRFESPTSWVAGEVRGTFTHVKTVPEPSTLAMLFLAGPMAVIARRRKSGPSGSTR